MQSGYDLTTAGGIVVFGLQNGEFLFHKLQSTIVLRIVDDQPLRRMQALAICGAAGTRATRSDLRFNCKLSAERGQFTLLYQIECAHVHYLLGRCDFFRACSSERGMRVLAFIPRSVGTRDKENFTSPLRPENTAGQASSGTLALPPAA